VKDVLAVVLAGGAGERLFPLTHHRAKPAVPFGGSYRIVDFALSNCINSQCRRILVLTQYKARSLQRHIYAAWNIMRRDLHEFVEVLPAQQGIGGHWYKGTADAIYQNLYAILPERPKQVLILAGDHIYKMDYQKMLAFHRATQADVTLAAIEVPIADARKFGILQMDRSARVIGFQEKPAKPEANPEKPDAALASMGIYIFNTTVLQEACTEDAARATSHDFGRDIIPRLIETHRVFAFMFEDENKKEAQYWRDVGTLDAYWEANMDLVAVDPHLDLYDRSWPIRTVQPLSPPAKFVFATPGQRFGVAVDSIVSAGCIVSGGTVTRSVLSPDVHVHSYSQVEESVLMTGVRVGRHAKLRRIIVDKYVEIPEGAVIGYDLEADRKRYHVTDNGIVIIARGDPDSLEIRH